MKIYYVVFVVDMQKNILIQIFLAIKISFLSAVEILSTVNRGHSISHFPKDKECRKIGEARGCLPTLSTFNSLLYPYSLSLIA